jgi:hypothetical protein
MGEFAIDVFRSGEAAGRWAHRGTDRAEHARISHHTSIHGILSA